MGKSPRTGSLAVLATAYDTQLAACGAGRRPWGRALRRWHVVSHIVWPVVGRWWDERNGPLPSRRGSPATNAARDHISELVGKHWADVDALCRAGMSLSAAGLEALATQGVHTPPSELSERVAVRIGAAYREDGSVPGSAELSALVTELVASFLRARAPRLAKAEFRAGLAEFYEREWEDRGVHSLEAFRPSLVGLGEDERPAFAPAKERGGWDLGLRRSVWGRYRLYSDLSAQTRSTPPADDMCPAHEVHEQLRDLEATEPLELAREEVRRVCSPYGLATDEHRGVVLAISQGLDLAESVAGGWKEGRSWSRWTASRCTALEAEIASTAAASQPDPAMVAAMRDFSGLWRTSPAGQTLEEWYGSVTTQLDLMLTAVARRIWMDLHRREREHVAPMRRAHVARAIRVAFCKGIPEAVQRRRRGLMAEPGTDEEGWSVREQERRNRTFEVLLDYAAEVASWHAMTLSGDLSWTSRYEEIIEAGSQGAGPDEAEPLLTGAELARILGEDWSDPA